MDFKDCLILGIVVLGVTGLVLANKAEYCEQNARRSEAEISQLEAEIIRLEATLEGFKESAVMLKD